MHILFTFIHSFIFIRHITHHYNKGELQRKLKEADGEETCRKETTGLIKNQVSSDWKKASLIWQYEPAKSCIGGRFSYLSIQRVVKLWKENEKPPVIGSAWRWTKRLSTYWYYNFVHQKMLLNFEGSVELLTDNIIRPNWNKWLSQGHPTTVLCKISVRRSNYGHRFIIHAQFSKLIWLIPYMFFWSLIFHISVPRLGYFS